MPGTSPAMSTSSTMATSGSTASTEVVAPARPHLPDRGGPDVDIHVGPLHPLLALLVRQQMGWLGADDAGNGTGGALDSDPLAQQDLVEPTSQRQKAQEALFGDVPDHEADLVHVAGKHDSRLLGGARQGADPAPDLVFAEL